MPVLVQMVLDLQGLTRHREQIHLVLRELFSNALEHGLLHLESGWKATPEGFARYYMERAARLAQLSDGELRIRLRHTATPEGGCLTMRIEDSGPGFDRASVGDMTEISGGHAGRGIKLVEELCGAVRYEGRGNEVEADYRWTRED